MALSPQMISVPFGGGVDTKTDPKQVQGGRVLELVNAQFKKTGELTKRNGFVATTAPPFFGTGALANLSSELLFFDGLRAWSLTESTSAAWASRGYAMASVVGDRAILHTTSDQQLNADVGLRNGIELYAWEDTRGGIWGTAIDFATGAVILPPQRISAGATGSKPKVINTGAALVVYYVDGANLVQATLNPSISAGQITATISRSTIASNVNANGSFDAVSDPAGVFIAYLTTAPAIVVKQLGGASTTIEATAANAYNGGPSVLSIASDTAGILWISWSTGTAVRIAGMTSAASIFQASTLVEAVSAVDTIAIFVDNPAPGTSGSSRAILFYEVDAASSLNHFIKSAVESTGSIVAGTVWLRGCGLASKPWTPDGTQVLSANALCLNVSFDSPLQASYFTVAYVAAGGHDIFDPPFVVARVQPGTGQGHRSNHMLAEVVPVVDEGVFWANGSKGKIDAEAGTVFSLVGVNRSSFDVAPRAGYRSTRVAGELLIAGGVAQIYDGIQFVELGFHVFPEQPSIALAGSGGSIDAGAHQWIVVYEYTDALGRIQRSRASVAKSATTLANDKATLTIPTLRLTAKGEVRIAIYRTTAAGALFFRITSILAPFVNDPTIDTVTFVDSASDASIIANELAYTTGGVLNNMAPPSSALITSHQARVFLAGLEDPNQIWFSKNRFDNAATSTIPVEFAIENTIGLDAFGGPITALASLDDKLVVFKSGAIFVLTGDGPNDTGAGDVYADPQLLTSDVGCVNPDSVALSPAGILFLSAKGLYLLDRSTSVSYIGAPVEDLLGDPITSATLHAAKNAVIFGRSSGNGTASALAYDYFFGQWSTWTNLDSFDAEVLNDQLYVARFDGSVWEESGGFIDGDGSYVALSVTTPNFSFADLSGYQRVYSVHVLGTYKSAHTLRVEVAYEGSDSYAAAATIAPQPGDDLYSYRVDFARQKCTAIRLRITDVAPVAGFGEGLSLSSLTFKVAAGPGGRKLPAAQQYGST
jgi:hypothetical protein